MALNFALDSGKPLVLCSSICPSYSANDQGVPTYEALEDGISYNTERHFDFLAQPVKKLEESGLSVVHFFLMADTEVDLLPFLKRIDLSPEEFIRRCQQSIEKIGKQTEKLYGIEKYGKLNIPTAARFLDFFGEKDWYERYTYFEERLQTERQSDPHGRIARGLMNDVADRTILIEKLLGNVSYEEKITHMIRQRAQYMAFASLMRERFGKSLVVVNHRTPNFYYMNDKIAREPKDLEKLTKGNYLDKLPLVELDISTQPEI